MLLEQRHIIGGALEQLNEQDRNRIKEQLIKFKIAPIPQNVQNVQKLDTSNTQFMTIFLSAVMILLTVAMMVLFVFKDGINKSLESPIPIVTNNFEREVQVADTTLTEDVEKLKTVVNQLSHQIWMLGLQANQNTAVAKHIARNEHANKYADRYVVINRNWGLDKIPDSIKFSEGDLEKLKKHLDAVEDKNMVAAKEADAIEMPVKVEEINLDVKNLE